ncbi:hypothetical protein, partial [Thiorhodococcus mannitoliphagus]|uniref:hypothetical protein n=1 Tax=Thiorhodococcus mannitoliphagus TaxID=329406 RepID=UPI00197DB493
RSNTARAMVGMGKCSAKRSSSGFSNIVNSPLVTKGRDCTEDSRLALLGRFSRVEAVATDRSCCVHFV